MSISYSVTENIPTAQVSAMTHFEMTVGESDVHVGRRHMFASVKGLRIVNGELTAE